jgi:hypothetical protein
LREEGAQRLLIIVPRQSYSLGRWPVGDVWNETFLTGLGEQEEQYWHDVLLQRPIPAIRERLAVPTILSDLPFAVLYRPGKT